MFLKRLPFLFSAARVHSNRLKPLYKAMSQDEIIRRGRLLTRQQEPMSRKAKAKIAARLKSTITH